MGFRFQRRLNLGNGTGLNVSKSGIGASFRNRYGSIGSKGFSVRTGIPGLSMRQSWGKGNNALIGVAAAAVAALVVGMVTAAIMLVLWFATVAIPYMWACVLWCIQTAQDYISYRRTGIQNESVPLISNPQDDLVMQSPEEKTLEQLMAESPLSEKRE